MHQLGRSGPNLTSIGFESKKGGEKGGKLEASATMKLVHSASKAGGSDDLRRLDYRSGSKRCQGHLAT